MTSNFVLSSLFFISLCLILRRFSFFQPIKCFSSYSDCTTCFSDHSPHRWGAGQWFEATVSLALVNYERPMEILLSFISVVILVSKSSSVFLDCSIFLISVSSHYLRILMGYMTFFPIQFFFCKLLFTCFLFDALKKLVFLGSLLLFKSWVLKFYLKLLRSRFMGLLCRSLWLSSFWGVFDLRSLKSFCWSDFLKKNYSMSCWRG